MLRLRSAPLGDTRSLTTRACRRSSATASSACLKMQAKHQFANHRCGVPQQHQRGHLPVAPSGSLTLHKSRRQRYKLVVRNLFTGIVQGTARVVEVKSQPSFSQLRIQFPPSKMDGIQVGASVALNGTCLTVTDFVAGPEGSVLSFDVIVETLRATNLGDLTAGSYVNFERSARVGDEIGGHNVSGHVHSTAHITNVEDSANNRRISYKLAEPKFMKYILPKGFVAVDGCSLTVGEVAGDTFTVYLIPETLRVTVHGIQEVGTSVNIEVEAQTQAIVDTVERVMARYIEQGHLSPAR